MIKITTFPVSQFLRKICDYYWQFLINDAILLFVIILRGLSCEELAGTISSARFSPQAFCSRYCFVLRQIVSPAKGVYELGETELIPCRISSTDSTNDFCPTPYAADSPEYRRVLTKLNVIPD